MLHLFIIADVGGARKNCWPLSLFHPKREYDVDLSISVCVVSCSSQSHAGDFATNPFRCRWLQQSHLSNRLIIFSSLDVYIGTGHSRFCTSTDYEYIDMVRHEGSSKGIDFPIFFADLGAWYSSRCSLSMTAAREIKSMRSGRYLVDFTYLALLS